MNRIALVSQGLPPSHSGQSLVIYHLLKDARGGDFILITQSNFFQYRYKEQSIHPLPFPYIFLCPDYQVVRMLARLACILHSEWLLDHIVKFRSRQMRKILEREKPWVVVVCTGDPFDPPSVYQAAFDLGIPLVFYALDYYAGQWSPDSLLAPFAESYEVKIFRYASQVIVPNEFLFQEYLKKYGKRASVIHNPVDIAVYENNREVITQGGVDELSIVYTGAVYEAHFDAFRNLLSAITKTGIPDLKLDLYCPQSPVYLRKNGITGPVRLHGHLRNDQMPGIQQSAGILFLPLAFRSPYPDIIRTSAPGKIGEYLASGRPVLVHAPAESFVAWYFRHYSCGYVVDDEDPGKLAEAITHLIEDKQLRQRLVENAYLRAKEDFDSTAARKTFLGIIEELA